jgi:hypothetical protein
MMISSAMYGGIEIIILCYRKKYDAVKEVIKLVEPGKKKVEVRNLWGPSSPVTWSPRK